MECKTIKPIKSKMAPESYLAKYLFLTPEFGVNEEGLHLLRNGFKYKTIEFREIHQIKIEKGKYIHNWFLVFVLGIALVISGGYFSINMFNSLVAGTLNRFSYGLVALPLLPLFGSYFIYSSLQAGLTVKVEYGNGLKDRFPLNEIVESDSANALVDFLKEKVGPRLYSKVLRR
jgi:hypothetical protein